jgi:predicted CXXCH cytochrome family protein
MPSESPSREGGFLSESEMLESPVTAADDIGAVDGSSDRRGRLVFAAILLLLLLLCTITTVVQTLVSRTPDQIRSITRNIECLQCHTELIPAMSKPSVHNPFLLKGCTACHTPHGKIVQKTVIAGAVQTWERTKTLVEWIPLKMVLDVFYSSETTATETPGGRVKSVTEDRVKGETSNLVLPADELCWMCHGNLGPGLSMAYPHSPFKEGFCTNCHNPHASDFRALLVQDERDLCVTCHPIGPELARKQVHPPVEGRYCLNCHSPHASEYRGILVDNQRDLCFQCHPSVAPLSLKPVQHNPFLYDNCTGCHEPHGSDYTPLLISEQPGICYTCHPDISQDFLKPSHHPVGTVQLNCGDCHNPHAADYPGLISAENNAMCYQCHRVKIATSYEKSAHKETLCIRCHTPHGSNYAPLLIDRNPEVCLKCHNPDYYDAEHGNNHPARPYDFDVNAQKPLTCTSTCHNPHGTTYNYMLMNFASPFDGQCLQCHGKVGYPRVGIDF